MASHHSIINTSNDMVDNGAEAGEGWVDMDLDMVRRIVLEANQGMIECPSPTPHGNDEGSSTAMSSTPGESDDGVDGVEFLTAAGEGRVDVVMQVLETNRDMILVGDPIGNTAFHIAAKSGHCNLILELIKAARSHGQLKSALADQNADGDRPLHLAIKNRHMQVAQYLIDACDPDHREESLYVRDNKDGEYPRQLAQQYGYMSFVSSIEMKLRRRALKEEAEEDLNTWDNLQRAVQLNQEMVVMRILGEKPSLIRYSDKGRGTVFHAAALGGSVHMIRRLVEYITTTNSPDACNELARLMSIQDYNGDNPLFVAIQRRNITAALYLTELAPQTILQLNNVDVCPLRFTIMKAYQDLLNFMIDQALVSESIKDRLFSYATEACLAHVAIKAEHLGTLQVLMNGLPFLINSSNAKGWKPLSYAASNGHLDQVRFLLTKFPNSISIYDKDGSMPIHKAIAGGHIPIVKEFIAQCPQTLCDIDQKGRTTLHIATRYRKAEILCYLLKQKDVNKILNTRDKEGNTFQDMVNDLKTAVDVGGGPEVKVAMVLNSSDSSCSHSSSTPLKRSD